MSLHRILALPLLLLLLGNLLQGRAAADDAGQAIHRCVGPDGGMVFSGLPCAEGSSGAASALPDSTPMAPLLDACASSREDLRDRVAAAVARHDSNALAGLLRWSGLDSRSADSRLRTLRELVARPLVAIDANEDFNAGWSDPAGTDGDRLHLRTGSDAASGPREHDFGVANDERCYWLTW